MEDYAKTYGVKSSSVALRFQLFSLESALTSHTR